MSLLNTLEAPGEFDAMTTLRPGEPYFLLVGRDKLAPAAVDRWAKDNRQRALADHKAGRISQEKLNEELRKSTQAEEIGWAMTAYKRGDEERITPTEQPSRTYTGHELPEQTQKTDKLQSLRARAASALSNAAAELAELVQFMDDNFSDDAALADIANLARQGKLDAVDCLAIVEPPRVGLKR